MKANPDECTVVVVGAWNRRLLYPRWLTKHVFKTADDVGVEMQLSNPLAPPRFSAQGIRLLATDDAYVIEKRIEQRIALPHAFQKCRARGRLQSAFRQRRRLPNPRGVQDGSGRQHGASPSFAAPQHNTLTPMRASLPLTAPRCRNIFVSFPLSRGAVRRQFIGGAGSGDRGRACTPSPGTPRKGPSGTRTRPPFSRH